MKLKGLVLFLSIMIIFGIIELIVYGVILLLKKLFIVVCIGGGIGGVFVVMNYVKNFMFGLVSMLSLFGFIFVEIKDIVLMIIGVIGVGIVFIIVFVLMFVLCFED